MKEDTLEIWMEHPVTSLFFKHISELKKLYSEQMTNYVMGSLSLHNIDTHLLAELKGQVHILDSILDIKEFFNEDLDKKEEIKDVETSRSKNQD